MSPSVFVRKMQPKPSVSDMLPGLLHSASLRKNIISVFDHLCIP